MTSGSSSTINIEEGPSPKLNVQLLMKIQGDRSKKWWNVSIALQVGIIFLSAYSTMTQNLTTLTALFLIPILSVLAPLMRWRADYLKGDYQSLLRKFEFFDGLGWAITPRERSEWLLTLTEKQRLKVTASDRMPQHYFASKKQPSVTRLLENLEETSWWSKHLGKFSCIVIGSFTVLVIIGSFTILLISVQAAISQTTLINIVKVIVSVLAALFSIGFVRLTIEFWIFSQSSAKFEETTCRLLDSSTDINQEEATKLLHEYQITRSAAPMIPTWAWKWNEEKLNAIWEQQRCR